MSSVQSVRARCKISLSFFRFSLRLRSSSICFSQFLRLQVGVVKFQRLTQGGGRFGQCAFCQPLLGKLQSLLELLYFRRCRFHFRDQPLRRLVLRIKSKRCFRFGLRLVQFPRLQEPFATAQMLFQPRLNLRTAKLHRHLFEHALGLRVAHIDMQRLAQERLRPLQILGRHQLMAIRQKPRDRGLLRGFPDRLERMQHVFHRLIAVFALFLQHLVYDRHQFFRALWR